MNFETVNEITDSNFHTICQEIELLSPEEEIKAYKKLRKIADKKIINKIQQEVNRIKNTKRSMYLNELFYCIYFHASYKQCIYVIISSALVHNIACIIDGTYHIEGVFYPKNITRFLNSIKIHASNSVAYELLEELHACIETELLRQGFIFRLPIFGQIKTRKYKKFIKSIENQINNTIKTFIHTDDITNLKNLDSRIADITFVISPSKKFKSFYSDTQDAVNAAMSAKYGRPRKYKAYYSITGHKYPIE